MSVTQNLFRVSLLVGHTKFILRSPGWPGCWGCTLHPLPPWRTLCEGSASAGRLRPAIFNVSQKLVAVCKAENCWTTLKVLKNGVSLLTFLNYFEPNHFACALMCSYVTGRAAPHVLCNVYRILYAVGWHRVKIDGWKVASKNLERIERTFFLRNQNWNGYTADNSKKCQKVVHLSPFSQ